MDYLAHAFLGALFAVVGIQQIVALRSRGKVWRAAAAKLGLEQHLPKHLRGTLGGLDVTAFLVDDLKQMRSLRGHVVVRVVAREFPPCSTVELLRAQLGLEGEVTEAVQPFRPIAGGLEQSVYGETQHAETLVEHVRRVVEAVERVRAASIPEMLAWNVTAAHPAQLRLKSLLSLLQDFAKHEDTARALQAALADPEPEVRFLAASEAGPAALEAFVTDSKVPPELRVHALEKLETAATPERLSAILGKVLDVPGDAPRLKALSLIASRRDKSHEARLCEADFRDLPPELAQAYAHALVAMGVRSERAMVGLLGSCSRTARVVAIGELAEWGTVSAVAPLLALETQGVLGAEAREAARAIQRRASGEPGGVSLVQDTADLGAVSLTDGHVRQKS